MASRSSERAKTTLRPGTYKGISKVFFSIRRGWRKHFKIVQLDGQAKGQARLFQGRPGLPGHPPGYATELNNN